ncbi:glutamyl aminopeptidase [Trichosurus vulpecula]|uniref:glutamyl aminopeptidase n=1 Tax=Trichosurus vulpecula TaxID=9337 RepID=UPI00186B02FF|nr:glutamyl aminopeptidase [Trichosurus vulpecula]XP_036619403.1 glutamyl aminopeptidase [Trichosurus vulpecula]
MNSLEYETSKRYCIRKTHVVIICVVVVAVGLIVGLSVGLTRSCKTSEQSGQTPTIPGSASSTSGPSTLAPQEASLCPASTDESGPWTSFRLPTHINPVHYDLEVKPVMEEDTYTGTVTIHINVTQSSKYLWLHLRETWITEPFPTLKKSSGEEVPVTQCFEYTAQEYVVIELEEELPPNDGDSTYLLTMNFKGWLNGSLVGFYRTTYTEDGVTKSIAATDHEPTDARKSFPCFDEPNKKATFTISIVHPKEYSAISNMPVEKEEQVDDEWNRTIFMKSVPMSTYLVAFAVHQFTSVDRTSARGIPLKIYVQPLERHTAEYAANITKIVFDYYEEYFAMNYSLPKLDKIAIPDFGTGAMENWGLITYRETNLLYDPEESASSNQQRVAAVIAHELVHQWFGNIVTMDWWDDLWLNEGFASFFEFLGVNHAEDDWQMLDQILLEDVLPVQEDDSLISSHPIVVDVTTPDEITSVFDGISYSKGASILRMVRDWITPEKFQLGCQQYLKKHEFKNAKTDDFWAALEEASNKPVKEVMDTWTRQMGYPVLTVGDNWVLKQSRFLLDPQADPSQPTSDFGYKWNIPIRWSEGDNNSSVAFYNASETEGIILDSSSTGSSFLKINPDHIGFYRVNYEVSTWNTIATELLSNHLAFSSGDRASFFDDAFALSRANHLDYRVSLNLTLYLNNENDYLTWDRVISALSYITSMLEDDTELYPLLKEYVRSKVKPVADSLKWEDEGGHLEKLLRASVLGLACKVGDTDALNNASELFMKWQEGTSQPVNLRLLVYRYGMQNSGDEDSWNYMLSKYQTTTLAQEKEKLLYGLASVNNVTLLSRYLELLKDTELIKTQDVFTVIQYISYNSYGKYMAWDWIRLNWEYLVDRFTLNNRNLGRIVTIAEPFNTEFQLWQIETFFNKYPEAGAGASARENVLETVKNNIEWLKLHRENIKEWLLYATSTDN